MEKLLAKFKAEKNMNWGDFMMFFAELHVEKIQYGGRTELCNFLMSKVAPELDFWKRIDLMVTFFGNDADPPQAYDRNVLSKPAINTTQSMRQWTYQYCTELGYFQTQDFDHYMRS